MEVSPNDLNGSVRLSSLTFSQVARWLGHWQPQEAEFRIQGAEHAICRRQ
jgi:hypothetical protein